MSDPGSGYSGCVDRPPSVEETGTLEAVDCAAGEDWVDDVPSAVGVVVEDEVDAAFDVDSTLDVDSEFGVDSALDVVDGGESVAGIAVDGDASSVAASVAPSSGWSAGEDAVVSWGDSVSDDVREAGVESAAAGDPLVAVEAGCVPGSPYCVSTRSTWAADTPEMSAAISVSVAVGFSSAIVRICFCRMDFGRVE